MAGDRTVGDQTITIRVGDLAADPTSEACHFLTFTQGGAQRRVQIGPAGLTVGRQSPSDLVIPMPDISRRHCRIDVDGDWAQLTDLGSTNGTFLAGQRLAAPARLRNGARISLGTFPLRYERRDPRDVAQEAELSAELQRAADYVRAILPPPLTTPALSTEWWFVPSAQLGGDAFGYQFITPDLFTGFVLDVSGHGIGSAMHAANVANALRRRALPGVDFADPAQVAAALNAVFPMEEHNGLMLTLWYFAYHLPTRRLRYCAAGHHPSFLRSPGDAGVALLWQRSPAIGMLPRGNWAVGEVTVARGSSLYVFSDGAFEIVTAAGAAWTIETLRDLVALPAQPATSEPQRLYQAVRAVVPPGPLEDDFSVLVVRFD